MGLIKDLLRARADKKNDFISEWYWRRQYNKLRAEMDSLLEVMRSDIYDRVVKEMTIPLELKRYKRENDRLRNKCKVLLEERNRLDDTIKIIKKGGTVKNGKEKGNIVK